MKSQSVFVRYRLFRGGRQLLLILLRGRRGLKFGGIYKNSPATPTVSP